MTNPLSIGVTTSGLTTPTDLRTIRTALQHNSLALQYIPRFLNYANQVLANAERLRRTPYDEARAQVTYGNTLFEVSRIATHRNQ